MFTTKKLNQLPLLFSSKNINNPEDYSLDFLKEKIKPFCYYLYSFLGEPILLTTRIFLEDDSRQYWWEQIVEMQHLYGTNNSFLQRIEKLFFNKKTDFRYKMPTEPFSIIIIIEGVQTSFNQLTTSDNEEEDNEEEYSEEEDEK